MTACRDRDGLPAGPGVLIMPIIPAFSLRRSLDGPFAGPFFLAAAVSSLRAIGVDRWGRASGFALRLLAPFPLAVRVPHKWSPIAPRPAAFYGKLPPIHSRINSIVAANWRGAVGG